MSIKVTCPNGHALQVKSEFAGKAGLCPHCKARIVVPKPEPEAVSEDDLLEVLGPPRVVASHGLPPASRRPIIIPRGPREEPKQDEEAEERRSAATTGRFVAPATEKGLPEMLRDHLRLPCRLPAMPDAAVRMDVSPAGRKRHARAGSRSLCHYLGLRKQGGVIVIRFGEHRILDELTVKKFGDELFHVADRPDCQNLLLNFFGVVGLSSAMLGIMLMLRKKMGQKPGKLKLCQVGPEIMDVFHATKLGQLFEILGTEQQGLKAFA